MFCLEAQRRFSTLRFVLRHPRKDVHKPRVLSFGFIKKTHSCTDDDLVLSVWLEPRITVSSLNTFEPVNGLNKRLFYCQNHEVHKQNCYVFFLLAPERFFPETFNHKTNLRGASRSDTIC